MILSVMAPASDRCIQHYLRELLHAEKVAYSDLYIKLSEKWSGPNRTSRTARAASVDFMQTHMESYHEVIVFPLHCRSTQKPGFWVQNVLNFKKVQHYY